MSSITLPWEEQLLEKAIIALKDNSLPQVTAEFDDLDRAYEYCSAITSVHSRTFYLASSLLKPGARKAARALYAFCRVSDDIVDHGIGNVFHKLQVWKRDSLMLNPPKDHMVPLAWAQTRARYQIPRQYAEHLLDGVAQDIFIKRYNAFDDLVIYCYGVASTVGLMSMHIIGFESEEAIPYAIKLGVALQITNILRDVGEDWQNGRLYLPLEEIAAFGLTENDIAEGVIDERWEAFMRFQIARARRLFEESLPGIALLDKSGRTAIAAAAELYASILGDIEKNNYDVFNRRAHVSGFRKLLKLPGIWWRSRFGRYSRFTGI